MTRALKPFPSDSMNWLITNFLASFLLLGLAGVMLLKRQPKQGRRLIIAMLVLLWLFSLPVVGSGLLALLERGAHTPPDEFRDAQAIVVLGGGTYFGAPEYGGDTVSTLALERLRLAAMLQQRSGLPVLVTGGNPERAAFPEGVLMKKVLTEEFGVPVRWVEAASGNTWQNAFNSREILAPAGVTKVVLVTHGWHMPRAKYAFERAGFRVIPAGTGFHGGRVNALSFLPSARGLRDSHFFMHEAIGLFWYRLKG